MFNKLIVSTKERLIKGDFWFGVACGGLLAHAVVGIGWLLYLAFYYILG